MSKKADQVAKTGRPSGYSEEVADTICQELMEGKGLRTICALEGMPGAATVYKWLGQYEGFQERYAHAREVQADVLADEIIEIADSETDPNRARVMIDPGSGLPRNCGRKSTATAWSLSTRTMPAGGRSSSRCAPRPPGRCPPSTARSSRPRWNRNRRLYKKLTPCGLSPGGGGPLYLCCWVI